MDKWEYKFEYGHMDEPLANNLGYDGWELVQVLTGGNGEMVWVFKRLIPGGIQVLNEDGSPYIFQDGPNAGLPYTISKLQFLSILAKQVI